MYKVILFDLDGTIRLEHAAKLLRTTKLTVSEIMFKCGFSNKSYFFDRIRRGDNKVCTICIRKAWAAGAGS